MNKTTTYYFETTKKLPVAMTFDKVQTLVAEVGIPPKPPKSGWSFKNFLIMTTSIITISTALLFAFNGAEASHYQSRNSILSENVFQYNQNELLNDDESFYGKYQESQNDQNSVIDINDEQLKPAIAALDSNDSKLNKMSTKEVNEIDDINDLPDLIDLKNDDLFESSNSGLFESGIESFGLFDEPGELHVAELDTVEIDGSTKTITKTIDLDKIETFVLTHKQGDIIIKNTNSNTAKLIAKVTIESNAKEDETLALKDFEVDFEKMKKELHLKYNWGEEEIGSCSCWPTKKNKLKLSDGTKVKIKKIRISYTIELPSSLKLNLTNSYGDLNIPNRAADVKASVFQGNFNAGKIDADLVLNQRYGDALVESVNVVEFGMFKGSLNLTKATEIKGKQSYSKLDLGEGKNLDLTSFQSDANIGQLSNSLTSNFRYGDLVLTSPLENLKIVGFQAKIDANDINYSDLNLSYTKFKMNNGSKIKLERAFQSDILVKKIGIIEGCANYTPVKAEELTDQIVLKTFQGSVDIEAVNAGFSKVNLDTRYTNVNVGINSSANYSVEAKTAYTKVELPTNMQNVKLETSNSNNHNHVLGEVNTGSDDSKSSVYINSFQGKVKFD